MSDLPAELVITDGTTRISLIKEDDLAIFYLNAWRPMVPSFKGGGAFSESALADGRRIIDYRWASVMESYDLKVKDAQPDSVIYAIQEL
jgi:hypothetical protein